MASSIQLSSASRAGLLSLQNTTNLIAATQGKLSTGLKVASAVDDAISFFQAQALSNRSSDLNEKKDGIDQGISTLKAASNGVDALDKTLRQLKGLAQSAKTATATEQVDLTDQFTELLNQLDQITNDASYQGLNLLNSTAARLTVEFSTSSTSVLSINGRNLLVSGLFTGGGGQAASEVAASFTALGAAIGGFSATGTTVSAIDDLIGFLEAGIDKTRGASKALSSNITFLQTRLDFTKQYTQSLQEGAGKLTLADTNEEGASLVALQTRQQIGLQALAFAGQSEQSVLTLFR